MFRKGEGGQVSMRMGFTREFHAVVMVLLLSGGLGASARVINVGPAGEYQSIQAALNASAAGDEIVIAPGRYVEYLYMPGRDVILRSTEPDNPDIAQNTIIDAGGHGYVITFDGTETPNCVLWGLTITGGNEVPGPTPHATIPGGGIDGAGTHATIRGNFIRNNAGGYTQMVGGGSGLVYCRGLIERNFILHNSGGYGSPGGLSECGGTLQNNVIAGNSSWVGVGGIGYFDGLMRNNTIVSNGSFEGTGALENCSGTIINCIIYGNGEPALQIQQSATPSFCCIEGWTGSGVGNIAGDPRFFDGAHGDYRLCRNSPCIDQCSAIEAPPTDIRGVGRPQGDGADMGAYEYVPGAPPSFVFTELPRGGWLSEGDTLLLRVGVTGAAGQVAYQWKKDGLDLPGEASGTYEVSSVSLADTGRYSCRVEDESKGIRETELVLVQVFADRLPAVALAGLAITAAACIAAASRALRRGKF